MVARGYSSKLHLVFQTKEIMDAYNLVNKFIFVN
jgi:hypothetical protein